MLLNSLMKYFHSMFDPSVRGFRKCAGENSADNGGNGKTTQGASQTPGKSGSILPPERIGQSSSNNDQPSKRDDDDDEDYPGFSCDDYNRLACLFFKRNPRKYRGVTPCLGPGFIGIHRLK